MNDSTSRQVVVELSGRALGRMTMQATGRTRMNFAMRHLAGALVFSRQVCDIEAQHQGEPWGGTFYGAMSAPAIAVIMMTVAGMESYLNELFADAATYFPPPMLPIWRKGAKDFDRKPLLDKVDWFLLLRGKENINRNAVLIRDVDALVTLRNALVHFKPEWDNELDRHESISKKLEGKFPPLSWLASDRGVFPRAWVTGACTKWAVNSSIAFVDHVADCAEIDHCPRGLLDRLN